MASTSLDRHNKGFEASLPAEIVRLILEMLGRDNGHAAAGLVRISKLVQSWILPVLYETIILKRTTDLSQIHKNFDAHPELASHVHNLCLPLDCPPDTPALYRTSISALLAKCPHIRAVYLGSTPIPLHYSAVQLPRLARLHCGSWDAWMAHDILTFRPLTHLRADLVHNFGVQASWARLFAPPPHRALPHLTHLALGADGRATLSERLATTSFLSDVLAARPGLVMVVITLWFAWGADDMTPFTDVGDERLCVLATDAGPDDKLSLAEWEAGVRGKRDIWDEASAIIKRHREAGVTGVAVGSIVMDPEEDFS